MLIELTKFYRITVIYVKVCKLNNIKKCKNIIWLFRARICASKLALQDANNSQDPSYLKKQFVSASKGKQLLSNFIFFSFLYCIIGYYLKVLHLAC